MNNTPKGHTEDLEDEERSGRMFAEESTERRDWDIELVLPVERKKVDRFLNT
ncbi:hypothetical protein EIP86_000178 [Pleurotus ostreatoroseus]|nr:hypothetical protein EIP86_000178 [Pleurotus ostreatoroseus]